MRGSFWRLAGLWWPLLMGRFGRRIGVYGWIAASLLCVGDVHRRSNHNGEAEASEKSNFLAHGCIPSDVQHENRRIIGRLRKYGRVEPCNGCVKNKKIRQNGRYSDGVHLARSD